MKGFAEAAPGVFIKKDCDSTELRLRILNAKSIVSDFDGSLLPGFAAVPPALLTLEKLAKTDALFGQKLAALKKLLRQRKKYSVEQLSRKYASLLSGVSERQLFRMARLLGRQNRLFPGAAKFLRLISKTAEITVVSYGIREITKAYCARLSCRVFCRRFETKKGIITGRIIERANAERYKVNALKNTGLWQNGYDLGIGNGEEDAAFLSRGRLRILVNPSQRLVRQMNPDIVLLGERDPWAGFCDWLFTPRRTEARAGRC